MEVGPQALFHVHAKEEEVLFMHWPPSLHLSLSSVKVSCTHFQSRKTEAQEGSATCSKSPS